MRQTGNSFLFNIFVIGAQPRAPDVHHFQSHIKIWGPHPEPFIPQGAGDQLLYSPPSPIASGSLWATRGQGDDRAKPVAVPLMEKSPRLQVQLLTRMTVNQEESQKQMPQAPSYSDYEGSSVPGPMIHPLLCWGSLLPKDWMGIDKNGDLHIIKVPKTQKDPLRGDGLRLRGRERDERKRIAGFLPSKLVPI